MTGGGVRASASLAPRAHFPAMREHVYLDQGSIGLVPTSVAEVMRRFTSDVARLGTIALDEEAEGRILDGARRASARLIGARADEIAIVSSATEVLNQIAWWLKPGQTENVVVLAGDFPSVTLPWMRLAEDTGVDVRLVPTRAHPEYATAAAIAEFVDERTAAICVGHVQYASGHRLDVGSLGALAASANACLIIDATQSAGAVAIDVGKTPVDVLVASSHKWLCAPHGVAFCYLSGSLAAFRPPFVGWRGMQSAFHGESQQLASDARRCELGTVAYGAGLALEAGIAYLENLGFAEIERQGAYLAEGLIAGLTDLGATMLTPKPAGERAGIVAARFRDREARDLVANLRRRGVIASTRQDALRFSLHVFNDVDDVDAALAAVSDHVR